MTRYSQARRERRRQMRLRDIWFNDQVVNAARAGRSPWRLHLTVGQAEALFDLQMDHQRMRELYQREPSYRRTFSESECLRRNALFPA